MGLLQRTFGTGELARIEVPFEEQLDGLRKARDRYADLAAQVENNPDPTLSSEDIKIRKFRAQKIASAYEKSVRK